MASLQLNRSDGSVGSLGLYYTLTAVGQAAGTLLFGRAVDEGGWFVPCLLAGCVLLAVTVGPLARVWRRPARTSLHRLISPELHAWGAHPRQS